MSNDQDHINFENTFHYRFQTNWALRNILLNYFVFWRGTGTKALEKHVSDLHHFIQRNATFKRAAYYGIGEMLMADGIFDEEGSGENHPGAIPNEQVAFIESVVNKEYGLSVSIPEDRNYSAAQFLWNVCNMQDKEGKKNRRNSSNHMYDVVKKLFIKHLKHSIKIQEIEGHHHAKFLVLSDVNENYRWSFQFVSSDELINDKVVVFDKKTIYEEKFGTINPDRDFPTICGTYFGNDIKFYAKYNQTKLIQVSSIFKLCQGIDTLVSKGCSLNDIALHLDLIPKDPAPIISVGRGLKLIDAQLGCSS